MPTMGIVGTGKVAVAASMELGASGTTVPHYVLSISVANSNMVRAIKEQGALACTKTQLSLMPKQLIGGTS